MSCSAVIVAAGSSRRMGFDKVLVPLLGVPLIRHSVAAFNACDAIEDIVIVVAAERLGAVREAVSGLEKVAAFPLGGETRAESVARGLAAVSGRFVAVHDAARPLVTTELIGRCVSRARGTRAATAAERLTDTLQRGEGGEGVEVVPRDDLWRIQTPQVFETAFIREALASAEEDGAVMTDETSAALRAGVRSSLVENLDWNFKVTIPRDVPLAEAVLRERAAEMADGIAQLSGA
ncbi:MAG: 2-C-methyl-D-erythritol 4-phosphate cytidylyltransferase [Chthoniobacterales bacterium]